MTEAALLLRLLALALGVVAVWACAERHGRRVGVREGVRRERKRTEGRYMAMWDAARAAAADHAAGSWLGPDDE